MVGMSTLRPHAAKPYVTSEDRKEISLAILLKKLPEGFTPSQATATFGWGSVSHACGNEQDLVDDLKSIAPRESYRFEPELNSSVVAAALSLVPEELVPRKGDTKESLALRVGRSSFFDELAALAGGRGPKRVRLNETSYGQPRRISWSVVVKDVHLNSSDGTTVRTMYAYGKPNSRIRTEVLATPMPWPVFELGVQCFLSVRHALAKVCE